MAADEVRRLTALNPTSLLLMKDTPRAMANISLDQTLATQQLVEFTDDEVSQV